MEQIKKLILNRRDVVSFNEFWFRDVIERPLVHFEKLKKSGWPIDPGKAATVVNPEYYRFRIEDLTVGVL